MLRLVEARACREGLAVMGALHEGAGTPVLPGLAHLPPPPQSSCLTCTGRPCLTARSVGRMGQGAYDVASCGAHLRGAGRTGCLASGCAVRHACPAGAAFRPLPRQAHRDMAALVAGLSHGAATPDDAGPDGERTDA